MTDTKYPIVEELKIAQRYVDGKNAEAILNAIGIIEALAEALEPFAFAEYEERFSSTDGGCTEVFVADDHVQRVRAALAKAKGEAR